MRRTATFIFPVDFLKAVKIQNDETVYDLLQGSHILISPHFDYAFFFFLLFLWGVGGGALRSEDLLCGCCRSLIFFIKVEMFYLFSLLH